MREKARKVQGLGRKGIAKNYPKWLKADLGKSLGRFNVQSSSLPAGGRVGG